MGDGVQQAVTKEWLDLTLASWPAQTARMLREVGDPFRNPVGAALKEALPEIVSEALAGMDETRIRAALDRVVRIRAVQDFTPSQAVSFVFLLKDIFRRHGAAGLEERVDRLALLAFDLYMECREQLSEIRVREARRRMWVMERMAGKEAKPEYGTH
ncbi:MAG: RsbRD N-terminal domain-containing protein [Bryobacteraceae bacterium]|nr:RsbRD N-terminal domain-containing protein [Bryobacteraceae bacterium]